MPISEKTVEINVSAELLSYLFRVTGRTHAAIAPTQRAEGRLGYDVGYYGTGWACLIQYKRAYRRGSVWEWKLNRNRRKNQHQILTRLERAGIPVYYAFPFFAEPSEVLAKRIQLLRNVFWFRPTYIKPKGGLLGHHEVVYDPATQVWSVRSSSPEEIQAPDSLPEFLQNTLGEDAEPIDLDHLETRLNEILAEEYVSYPDAQGIGGLSGFGRNQSLLVGVNDSTQVGSA